MKTQERIPTHGGLQTDRAYLDSTRSRNRSYLCREWTYVVIGRLDGPERQTSETGIPSHSGVDFEIARRGKLGGFLRHITRRTLVLQNICPTCHGAHSTIHREVSLSEEKKLNDSGATNRYVHARR